MRIGCGLVVSFMLQIEQWLLFRKYHLLCDSNYHLPSLERESISLAGV